MSRRARREAARQAQKELPRRSSTITQSRFSKILVNTGRIVFVTPIRHIQRVLREWWRLLHEHPRGALLIAILLLVGIPASIAGILRFAQPEPALVFAPFEITVPGTSTLSVTGVAIANNLVDEFRYLLREANQPRQVELAGGDTRAVSLVLSRPVRSSAAELKIGGISPEIVGAYWNKLRQKQRAVTGEVVFAGTSLFLQARVEDGQTRKVGPYPFTEEGLSHSTNALAIKLMADFHPAVMVRIYAARGEKDKAIELSRSWVSASPADPEAYIHLGSALTTAGDMPNAIANFQTALRLKPDSPNVFHELGVVYAVTGQLQESLDLLRRAAEKLKDPIVFTNLATVLARLSKFDESTVYFEKALALRPNYYVARLNFATVCNNRGVALMKAGQYREAVQYYKKAKELGGSQPSVDLNLATALSKSGDKNSAFSLMTLTYQQYPDSPDVALTLASFLASTDPSDREGKAYQLFRKALSLKPQFPEALSAISGYLERRLEFDEALPYLNQSIALTPDNPELFYMRGVAFQFQGKRSQAIADFQRAIELTPDVAKFHFGLGYLLQESGLNADAEREFAKARHLTSGNK